MSGIMKNTIRYLLLGPVLGSTVALADSVFIVEDPPVDFDVVDAEPFDGFGDNGPYPTFNIVLLGTEGETREIAEFDISPFTIPPGESISSATFQVRITGVGVSGLGVNGEIPDNLAVDGYVGNGVAELSDFEAGDGNVLDSVDTPDPKVDEMLSFDVTSFLADLVSAKESFVGLTVRAEPFGGLAIEEGEGFPKLTIETRPEPIPTVTGWGLAVTALLVLTAGTIVFRRLQVAPV